MDGRVARLGNMSSKFGALYDSVLDRYSELMTFFGICYYLSMKDYFFYALIAFVALIGSLMAVSYTHLPEATDVSTSRPAVPKQCW